MGASRTSHILRASACLIQRRQDGRVSQTRVTDLVICGTDFRCGVYGKITPGGPS